MSTKLKLLQTISPTFPHSRSPPKIRNMFSNVPLKHSPKEEKFLRCLCTYLTTTEGNASGITVGTVASLDLALGMAL